MKILSFSIFLLLCLSLLASCGKTEKKQTLRCIYDHAVFAEISDEKQFSQFKRNPYFNLLWENHTVEEGALWLQKINNQYAFLKPKFDQFRQLDQIGTPRVHLYGDDGAFSPSTLRLIAMTGELCARVGKLENANIIQIGAGYGGWCKILSDILNFKSYTIVDLPEQLALAQKCLEKLEVKNVQFCTVEDLSKKGVYDLVISDMSFSEFNRRYQELFFDRIFSRSAFGAIFGHQFPKHFGVVSMNLEELEMRFKKAGMKCEVQELNKQEYSIFW